MKFKISIGLLLFAIFSFLILDATKTNAQTKASIHGELLDSTDRHPLELATVAIVNDVDTTLIAYTLTDRRGHFELTGLPVEHPIRVFISYVGYKTFRKFLILEKGRDLDMGKILFIMGSLGEVVIRGARSPIVIKKDTIEFNTEAFKTRPNAVVEELLKKLPGVQVNMDGSILIHGRPVSKLLVNGKAFFGNDPTVATRNLDASFVDKIQVYDDRDEDLDHKLGENQVNKVINLKLKKNVKKSTIGKAYAGSGTRGRYEAGGILSTFRDTLQVSLVGLGNNLNGTKFSYDDLNSMGGFDRSGGNQIYNGTFGRTQDDNNSLKGIEEVKAGGFNINNDYGEKLKLNLVYFYTNKKVTNIQKQKQVQMIPDSMGLTSSLANNALNAMEKHALSGLVVWNPDSLNTFRYEPSATFIFNSKRIATTTNSYNDSIPLLSRSNGVENGKGDDNSFSHNFSWYRKLEKNGESLNISNTLVVNTASDDDQSFNNLTSFIKDLSSSLFNRQEFTRSTNNSADLTLNYNYPVSQSLSAQITGSASYTGSSYSLLTHNKDPATGDYDLLIESQSDLLKRIIRKEELSPLFVYKIKPGYRLSFGLNSQWQDVNNHFLTTNDFSHNYFNFLPVVTIEMPGIRIFYNESISQPAISQLQPDTVVYSQLYKVTGNPSLQPQHSHCLDLSYNKYNANFQSNLMIYGSLILSQRNVVQDYTIGSNGSTGLSYVNRDGGLSAFSTVDYNKTFKKVSSWENSMDFVFMTYFSRQAFLLNNQEGIESLATYDLRGSASFDYNDILTLSGQYQFTRSATLYEKVQYSPVTTYVQNFVPSINLNWPRHVSLDASCAVSYNPEVPQGFRRETNILNTAVSFQIQKHDRGQLKLSAYDLLNQNLSVFRSAANNAIITNEQQLLRRYFLLTYLYKFNIMK